MDMQILRPACDSLESKGKISYKESLQAWGIIRLKRELIKVFPQLKEKRANFSYKMVVFRSYKLLEKALKDMEKKDEPLPVLLFFHKERDIEQI